MVAGRLQFIVEYSEKVAGHQVAEMVVRRRWRGGEHGCGQDGCLSVGRWLAVNKFSYKKTGDQPAASQSAALPGT